MHWMDGIGGFAAGLAWTGAAGADDIKIGYINKMGDHPWFVAEVAGAKKAAEEAGATFVSQDVQFNANLTITTFDTMVGDGVKGIAIVVPDKALGPVIAQKAKAAGIPLVAVDDDIYYEDGSQVPYVGMNAYNIGARVGEELAALYKSDGWAGKEVRIASIEDRKADTCMQRNKGAEEAFLKAVPDFDPDEHRPRRLRQHDGQRHRRDDHDADRQSRHVTNWIFYSCNDDGVLGAARALENCRLYARPGHGHRHRRQPRLRRIRSRQAVGVPRHDVAQLGQSRRAGRQAAARLDQGQDAAAGAVLHRSRNTSPPTISRRTTRPSSASKLIVMRLRRGRPCWSRRRLTTWTVGSWF